MTSSVAYRADLAYHRHASDRASAALHSWEYQLEYSGDPPQAYWYIEMQRLERLAVAHDNRLEELVA